MIEYREWPGNARSPLIRHHAKAFLPGLLSYYLAGYERI